MTPYKPKVLVLDLETSSLDTDGAKIRCAGVWSNITDKYYYYWEDELDLLKKAILDADFVVTFNGKKFDVPVLYNIQHQMFKYLRTIEKKHIDVMDIIVERSGLFKVKFEEGYSLNAIAKALGFGTKVDNFDYKILSKPTLDKEDKEAIREYLKQDVKLTKDIYLYLENMFGGFSKYLPIRAVKRKDYLRRSIGSLAYTVICHHAGLKETYRDGADNEEGDLGGGDVLGPYVEEATGDIRCVDYASAYPHAYMQANLYTPCTHCNGKDTCEYQFTGGTVEEGWELKLRGTYCTKNGMGVIERVIQKLFADRMQAKRMMSECRDDPDRQEEKDGWNQIQQSLKIIINTIYGISGSIKFVQVFDLDRANDCTYIGRFQLNYLHYKLGEAKLDDEELFQLLYGDTDSAYIKLLAGGDKELEALIHEVITKLKAVYPFPQDTFKLEVEDPVDYIQFFRDEDNTLKKKKYIMLETNGKIVVKGIQVIRKDSTLLTRRIWKDFIQPYIRDNKDAKISKDIILDWMHQLLKEDMSLAATEFRVMEAATYNNPSQIQAVIATRYGAGRHLLIKNNRGLGVGKGVKYATMAELKGVDVFSLDLSRTLSDLSGFIKNTKRTFDAFM